MKSHVGLFHWLSLNFDHQLALHNNLRISKPNDNPTAVNIFHSWPNPAWSLNFYGASYQIQDEASNLTSQVNLARRLTGNYVSCFFFGDVIINCVLSITNNRSSVENSFSFQVLTCRRFVCLRVIQKRMAHSGRCPTPFDIPDAQRALCRPG